jgi:IS30 family transposase
MQHFTLTKRKILSELLQQGESYREIRKVINKSISSISDEINNNGGRRNYDPHKAHERALKNKMERKKRKKLEISEGLKGYVIEKLREDWSPEQIAGELRKQAQEKTVISTETIYQFIYSKEGKRLKLWKHLRHRKKPERVPWGSRKKRKISIPNRTSIHDRPQHINTREEFGHWEGDLMIFSEQRTVLAVFVERMTRKTIAVVNPDKTAQEMEYALHELISSAGPTQVKSITFDNGAENVCHQKVREDYMETFYTFFCDPYSSWQKGTVENTNKLLRQYLPRDISKEQLTQDYVDSVLEKLNNRPRKCLNFSSPNSFFSIRSV